MSAQMTQYGAEIATQAIAPDPVSGGYDRFPCMIRRSGPTSIRVEPERETTWTVTAEGRHWLYVEVAGAVLFVDDIRGVVLPVGDAVTFDGLTMEIG